MSENITRAAVAYAEAATNNDGYGVAAKYAAYALADLVDGATNKTEASKIIAEAMTTALAARNGGKRQNVGANKVTHLALAFDATINGGFTADDTALIGAVYRARVGKTDGGAKRIDAILRDATDAATALANVEAAARTAPKPPAAITVETVQKSLDKWGDAEWSDADRDALASMFLAAAEHYAAQSN